MSATPLLDRRQPIPARKPRRWAHLILGGVLGAVAIRFIPENALGDWAPLFLPLLFAAFTLSILLHELGHVAAGLLAGFEFYSLQSGALLIRREATGMRVHFTLARVLGGGLTQMIPRTALGLPRRYALLVAGGPLVTAVLLVVSLRMPWGVPAGCLLGVNALLALLSWLPYEDGAWATDGKRLLVLARQGPEAREMSALLYLMALDARGVAPADWPRDVVAQLSPTSKQAAVYLYLRQLGNPDAAALAAALEHVLAFAPSLPPDLLREYYSEAAVFHGVFRRDADLATAWLADARAVRGSSVQPDWDAFALGAIAAARDDSAGARAHWTSGLALLDRHPGTSGTVAAARTRLTGWLHALQA